MKELLTPSVALGSVVLLAVVLLGATTFMFLNDRDWALVVRVGDHDINRAALRDREAVLQFVVADQLNWIDIAHRSGRMDERESAAITADLNETLADPRAAAISSLVDGSLVHAYVSSEHIETEDADSGHELLRARISLTERRLSWVRIAWQPGAGASPEAPAESAGDVPDQATLAGVGNAVREALSSGADRATVAEEYRTAGWLATADTLWLPIVGPAQGIDAEVVAAARAAAPGPMEPVVGIGWVTIADIVDTEPIPAQGPGAQFVATDARESGVPESALRAWATERVEARAVRLSLEAAWLGVPTEVVRAAEVVIGPADPEGAGGPWVQLAHLVIADLPPANIPAGDGTSAERLAASLRTLAPADRRARFWALVGEAGANGGRSGELGFFVKEQLAAALAEGAFAAGVASGDVLGPITTDHGEELFLVEAKYEGALDDRAIGALMELRAGTTSLFDMARSLAPGEAARAVGGPWRAAPELPAESAAYQALFQTPVGELSDPFILGDQLVVARILEHTTAPPDEDALARLNVNGFDAWLAGQRTEATITYAPGEEAQSSPPPTDGGIPTQLPQATPRLPVLPSVP
jgi:hypothetical protein